MHKPYLIIAMVLIVTISFGAMCDHPILISEFNAHIPIPLNPTSVANIQNPDY